MFKSEDAPGLVSRQPQLGSVSELYERDRCVTLRQVVSSEALVALREEADLLVAQDPKRDYDLADNGCAFDPMEDVSGALPPTHAMRCNLDAYLAQRYRQAGPLATISPEAQGRFKALLSELAKVACSILATSVVYLFNEHFVVKPPSSAVAFAWHTDAQEQLAGLVRAGEYLSLWIALDDIGAHNGGLLVEPWRGEVESSVDDGAERTSYLTCEVSSGDAVAFGSTVWHSSTPNSSNAPRRVFYCQFSRSPIRGGRSAHPLCFAVPIAIPSGESKATSI